MPNDALRRRLQALETAPRRTAKRPLWIEGPGDAATARACDGQVFARQAGEPWTEFKNRVEASKAPLIICN
ncbi:hypothetical protein Deba_0114 [Desulfarculus baarsii DSM 2075]|uniref:Uncharacterized protein n=1 Tax=Desulfarculus baarsii (strain ATCC 33931 / DSM 2075 / LMG 7858 / VKM B-1802 / 2st14) TaxID=644282 RepID=E1QDH4_DESB2|nr:hypothetical protein Deba_0114 [Desulfarculus baarsii DSM 2075]